MDRLLAKTVHGPSPVRLTLTPELEGGSAKNGRTATRADGRICGQPAPARYNVQIKMVGTDGPAEAPALSASRGSPKRRRDRETACGWSPCQAPSPLPFPADDART